MRKQSILLALCLAAMLSLGTIFPAALSESAPTATQTPIPLATMMQRYQDVLEGKQPYIQCNTYDAVYTEATLSNEITQWYGYEFETPMAFTAFCLTDLDADGTPEIILKLSDDFGFELLRYENSAVYGFPFVARAMIDITVNGDIYGSSGVSDNSWYQIRFHENRYEEIETCRMQSNEAGGVQYFIGEKEVSQREYIAFCDGLLSKERPLWYEYTAENFKTFVSRF